MSKREKLFILYNGRAKDGDTNRASIYVTEPTEAKARKYGKKILVSGQLDLFLGGVWYEYDVSTTGDLVNETMRMDLPPAEGGRSDG